MADAAVAGRAGDGPRADPSRSGALAGARGVAACAVVLLHAGLYSASFRPGMLSGAVVRHFDSAVPLFLVLSSFLLYSPFAAAHADGRATPRVLAYAARRALRILPAYWVAFAATAVVYAALGVAATTASRPGSVGQAWWRCGCRDRTATTDPCRRRGRSTSRRRSTSCCR